MLEMQDITLTSVVMGIPTYTDDIGAESRISSKRTKHIHYIVISSIYEVT